MTEYLVDSGFLYASIDTSDRHYEAVDAVSRNLQGRFILPIPAVTETAYFISANLGVDSLARFLDSLAEGLFIFEAPIAEDYLRSAEILRKYKDANLDLVDVLIFAIAERLDIKNILTIDRRHFSMFRPALCDHFEILP